MNVVTAIILSVGYLASFIAIPYSLIKGWFQWWQDKRPKTVLTLSSFAGFVLATLSCLLAVSAAVYAQNIGGFPFYDPLLLRIYFLGGVLSLSGLVFALIGMLRTGPLRWHAPICAAGTFLFWLFQAAGE